MADYPITPVAFTAVRMHDKFWLPRITTNNEKTIPAVLRKCKESGRIDNFRKATGILEGGYVGVMPFEDTDVYKLVEGASCSLMYCANAELESRLDRIIEVIAAAQEADGYLYTNRTIGQGWVHPFAGPGRWTNLAMSHELYNSGHLYEAACAHFLATGKKSLLDVAIRNADLVCSVFGPGGRDDIPGHQIIEMGLASLYRICRRPQYIETALRFLENRGRHETRPLYSYADNPAYCQDHLPVLE